MDPRSPFDVRPLGSDLRAHYEHVTTGPLPDNLQGVVDQLRWIPSRGVRSRAVLHDRRDVLTVCVAAAALAFVSAVVCGLL